MKRQKRYALAFSSNWQFDKRVLKRLLLKHGINKYKKAKNIKVLNKHINCERVL